MDDNKDNNEETNVIELRPGFSLPNDKQELMERLATMKASYLEAIALNILETVIQQTKAVGLLSDSVESLHDLALVKESIMSLLARAANCTHRLQEFAEDNFTVMIDDEKEQIVFKMCEPETDIMES